jgi:hypothetical protein
VHELVLKICDSNMHGDRIKMISACSFITCIFPHHIFGVFELWNMRLVGDAIPVTVMKDTKRMLVGRARPCTWCSNFKH